MNFHVRMLAYLLVLKFEVVIIFLSGWYGHTWLQEKYGESNWLTFVIVVLVAITIVNLYYKFFKILITNMKNRDTKNVE